MPEPYKRHTSIKHWGFQDDDEIKSVLYQLIGWI